MDWKDIVMKKESNRIEGRNKALKAFRVFNRMTQQELAEKLDLSKSFISEMESGKKPATAQIIDRYSELFGVPSWEILYLGSAYDNKKFENKLTSKLLSLIDWIMSDESADAVKLKVKGKNRTAYQRRASDQSLKRSASDLAGV